MMACPVIKSEPMDFEFDNSTVDSYNGSCQLSKIGNNSAPANAKSSLLSSMLTRAPPGDHIFFPWTQQLSTNKGMISETSSDKNSLENVTTSQPSDLQRTNKHLSSLLSQPAPSISCHDASKLSAPEGVNDDYSAMVESTSQSAVKKHSTLLESMLKCDGKTAENVYEISNLSSRASPVESTSIYDENATKGSLVETIENVFINVCKEKSKLLKQSGKDGHYVIAMLIANQILSKYTVIPKTSPDDTEIDRVRKKAKKDKHGSLGTSASAWKKNWCEGDSNGNGGIDHSKIPDHVEIKNESTFEQTKENECVTVPISKLEENEDMCPEADGSGAQVMAPPEHIPNRSVIETQSFTTLKRALMSKENTLITQNHNKNPFQHRNVVNQTVNSLIDETVVQEMSKQDPVYEMLSLEKKAKSRNFTEDDMKRYQDLQQILKTHIEQPSDPPLENYMNIEDHILRVKQNIVLLPASMMEKKVSSGEGVPFTYEEDQSGLDRTKIYCYKCETCGKTFKHAGTLKVHKRSHTVETEEFKCSVCGKVCSAEGYLRNHMRTHAREYRVQGPQNKRSVSGECFSDSNSPNHEEMNEGVKMFQGDKCNTSFTRKTNLEIHKNYHTGFKCSYCEKTFSKINSFKTHVANHKRNVCDATSKKKDQDEKQIRKHKVVCPYVCAVCEKGFTDKESLSNHSITHKTGKEYMCGICYTKFNKSVHLKKHMKYHLENERYTWKKGYPISEPQHPSTSI